MVRLQLRDIFICVNIFNAAGNSGIIGHPISRNVSLGEQVSFTCTIQGQSSRIGWHASVPEIGLENKVFLKFSSLQERLSEYNLTVSNSLGRPSDSVRNETLIFIATRQLNGMVIECAAVDTRDLSSTVYSKFARLTVMSEIASGTKDYSVPHPENTTSASVAEDYSPENNTSASVVSGAKDYSVPCPEDTSASETDTSRDIPSSNSSSHTNLHLLSYIILLLLQRMAIEA